MEWYWILLITFGSVILYTLLVLPLWALMRAASLASRAEEKLAEIAEREEKFDLKGDK